MMQRVHKFAVVIGLIAALGLSALAFGQKPLPAVQSSINLFSTTPSSR